MAISWETGPRRGARFPGMGNFVDFGQNGPKWAFLAPKRAQKGPKNPIFGEKRRVFGGFSKKFLSESTGNGIYSGGARSGHFLINDFI